MTLWYYANAKTYETYLLGGIFMKKIFSMALAAVLAFGVMSGCTGNNDANTTDADNLLCSRLDSGKFVLGLDDSFPPMGF